MKYWHEVSTEERELFLKRLQTIAELKAAYKQPDWCQYPGALDGQMGCWSLGDADTMVNRDFCTTCDCSTDYEDKIQQA